MNKIIEAIKKPAKWILVGALGTWALLNVVIGFGNFGGGVDSAFGGLLYVLVVSGLAGATLYALIADKKEIARLLGITLLGYFIISRLLDGLNAFGWPFDSLAWAAGSFNFIALLCLLGTAAITVLCMLAPKFSNKTMHLVAFCGIAGYTALKFLSCCLDFGSLGRYGDGAWLQALSIIGDIALIVAVFVGYIVLGLKGDEFEAAAPAAVEEPAEAEPVEEAPVEEPVEEKPVEEEPVEEPTEEPVEEESEDQKAE